MIRWAFVFQLSFLHFRSFKKRIKSMKKHFIRKRKIESGKGKLEDEQDKEKSRNVRDAKSKSD
ncbi:hypothetical protein CH378_02410 [Leptospira kmetyi]|uniref:Uncharacterized protein n=1 Tax=Leptospira kmetyi TaxID=408139 RepID=A0ABX4NDJ7_9LEPT|nr:hypothetical protein CH378_02410 [Leptospira kmetyi]